jgi:hypothetical protein
LAIKFAAKKFGLMNRPDNKPFFGTPELKLLMLRAATEISPSKMPRRLTLAEMLNQFAEGDDGIDDELFKETLQAAEQSVGYVWYIFISIVLIREGKPNQHKSGTSRIGFRAWDGFPQKEHSKAQTECLQTKCGTGGE